MFVRLCLHVRNKIRSNKPKVFKNALWLTSYFREAKVCKSLFKIEVVENCLMNNEIWKNKNPKIRNPRKIWSKYFVSLLNFSCPGFPDFSYSLFRILRRSYKSLLNKKVSRRGIEPGPPGWKVAILTPRPQRLADIGSRLNVNNKVRGRFPIVKKRSKWRFLVSEIYTRHNRGSKS